MRTLKTVLLTLLIASVCAAVATRVMVNQRRQREAAERDAARLKAARAAELDRLAQESQRPETPAVAPTVSSQTFPESPSAPPATNTAPSSEAIARPSAPPRAPPAPPRRELQDPLARVALSLVGADPDAEAYWLDAIYNPDLPEQEREDLMEDLNEDGLSDPRHPGPSDYPLIMNRISLIEQIVPTADEFMLPHLWEAYKDLWNLSELARGRGEPVR